ncbi:hypothetical protein [Actinoallomurus sp. NPDC050550]|uniref:hypothetical protein n=1 Tax=Actinoallomurus sp. NPDC050550 TaxID=3154937 RepID=UPI0033C388E6
MSNITPAFRFAATFAVHNDAEMIEADPEVSARLLEAIEVAQAHNYLLIQYPAVDYYEEVPNGAELVEIHGAVRRAFALKLGEEVWVGYSEAGNGTPGFVWESTPDEFDRLAAFAR